MKVVNCHEEIMRPNNIQNQKLSVILGQCFCYGIPGREVKLECSGYKNWEFCCEVTRIYYVLPESG